MGLKICSKSLSKDFGLIKTSGKTNLSESISLLKRKRLWRVLGELTSDVVDNKGFDSEMDEE